MCYDPDFDYDDPADDFWEDEDYGDAGWDEFIEENDVPDDGEEAEL